MTLRKDGKDIRIVILSYGWVLMGEYAFADGFITLTNASIIRRWGTTKGLGQIALHGTTPDTILEPVGDFEAPIGSVVGSIRFVYEK